MNELVDTGSGTRLEVDDTGSGPTVVLMHGWPVTSFHWRSLLPALHEAGYRTLTVTLRGLGGVLQGGENLEKATLAKEVGALLAKLKIERFAVIGHDWGATVAYLLSSYHPGKCRALVVEEEILPGINVDIPSPGRDYYPRWHGPLNRAEGLAEELITGREVDYYRRFLTESAGKHELECDAVSEYVAAYTSPRKVRSQLRASLGYYRTSEEDAKAIAACLVTPLDLPVLAIAGEYAMGAAVEVGLKGVGASVRGVVAREAGHYPVEQSPEYCVPAILDFLRTSLND